MKYLLIFLCLAFSSMHAAAQEKPAGDIFSIDIPPTVERDFGELKDLAMVYLGNEKIAHSIESFSCTNYADTEKFEKLRKFMGLKQDPQKAVEIFKGLIASEDTNVALESSLIYALMQTNGVGVKQDRKQAEILLKKIAKKYPQARFYYEFYYAEIKPENICILDYDNLPQKIVSDEESPYTFIPANSLNWKNSKSEKDELGKSLRYLDDTSMKISEEGKVLVPIKVLQEIQGDCSDANEPTLLVNPSARNRFSSDSKVYAEERGLFIRPNGGGYFSYDYIGSLKNGVQVLKIFDNGGGSWTDCCIRFLGFEKCSTFSSEEKSTFVCVKNYGTISFGAKGGYSKYFMKDNVFAIYEIVSNGIWDNEEFHTKITFVSFEKSPEKRNKTIAELRADIETFRLEKPGQ